MPQSFLDLSKVTFGREIDPNTGGDATSGDFVLAQDQTNKFDAAASVMIYSNFYWGGITVDHLVKNNNSFTDIEPISGLKLTMFGGVKWVYKEGRRREPDQSVTFAFNYRKSRRL